MSSGDTLLQVLQGLVACDSRASTASAIAKRASNAEGCGKCSVEYVEDVIAVLDRLPYVEVLRKPSGRLAGLSFKHGTEGACSLSTCGFPRATPSISMATSLPLEWRTGKTSSATVPPRRKWKLLLRKITGPF